MSTEIKETYQSPKVYVQDCEFSSSFLENSPALTTSEFTSNGSNWMEGTNGSSGNY